VHVLEVLQALGVAVVLLVAVNVLFWALLAGDDG
jgi:hypothetical protein